MVEIVGNRARILQLLQHGLMAVSAEHLVVRRLQAPVNRVSRRQRIGRVPESIMACTSRSMPATVAVWAPECRRPCEASAARPLITSRHALGDSSTRFTQSCAVGSRDSVRTRSMTCSRGGCGKKRWPRCAGRARPPPDYLATAARSGGPGSPPGPRPQSSRPA